MEYQYKEYKPETLLAKRPEQERDTDGINFKAVDLESHFSSCDPIPKELQARLNIFETANPQTLRLNEQNPDDFKHLDDQIDNYLSTHPNGLISLTDGGLSDFLEITHRIVLLGTGEHQDGANYTHIKDAFDLNSRPKTKCAVFNRLFKHIFESLARKYNKEILVKHQLVSTRAKHAVDLPRTKSLGEKNIPHQYLTLISQKNGKTVFSTLDPYHSKVADAVENMDFTRDRRADSLRTIVDALVDTTPQTQESYTHRDQARARFYTEIPANEQTAEELAETALIVTDQIWPAFKSQLRFAESLIFPAKSKAKSMAEQYKGYLDKSSTHPSTLKQMKEYKDSAAREYGKTSITRTNLVHMQERMSHLVGESVDRLIRDIGQNQHKDSFREITLLIDIVDNVGNKALPVDASFWAKINTFIDQELIKNANIYKARFKEEEKIHEAKPIKYNRKQPYRILRNHFSKLWNRAPQLLSSSENVTPEYETFKAKILAAMASFGMTDWLRDIPKTPPTGSQQDSHFISLLKQELAKAGISI